MLASASVAFPQLLAPNTLLHRSRGYNRLVHCHGGRCALRHTSCGHLTITWPHSHDAAVIPLYGAGGSVSPLTATSRYTAHCTLHTARRTLPLYARVLCRSPGKLCHTSILLGNSIRNIPDPGLIKGIQFPIIQQKARLEWDCKNSRGAAVKVKENVNQSALPEGIKVQFESKVSLMFCLFFFKII